MIRWKKRRKCWVMFRNTSRRASGWVTRSGSTVIAELPDGKAWLRAPSVADAKAWCEGMPPWGWAHVIEEMVAIVVLPDGSVERRAIERTASIEMHWKHRMVRETWNDRVSQWAPIDRVVLHGQVFAINDCDPMTGQYVQWRMMAYSTPEYAEIAAVYAKEELGEVRRKHRAARLRAGGKVLSFARDYLGQGMAY